MRRGQKNVHSEDVARLRLAIRNGRSVVVPRDRRPGLGRVLAFALTALLGLPHCTDRQATPPEQHDQGSQPLDSLAPTRTSSSTIAPGSIPANDIFVSVAKRARNSVVNISSVRTVPQTPGPFSNPFFDDPLFKRFFGEEFERQPHPPRERQEQGLGSGVIVSSDGYIVTNNHVVEQADEITVNLADNRKFTGRLIGTDPKTDVAIIKIDATDLPVLPWGDSTQLQVGEVVLAVGNPFGLNQTVTMGIISAVGRVNMGIVDYEDFIQTDAAINPGNSGGALVNLKGELVGINTAIFSRSGGFMGIGFAIPSNMTKRVMDSLLEHGKVVRGWLGVSIQGVTPELAKQFGVAEASGALVNDVLVDSPAAKARFARGDIITQYDGKAVKDPAHLRTLVAETVPGATVTITVMRDGRPTDLSVTIAELQREFASVPRGEPGASRGAHALAGITVEQLPPNPPSSSARAGVADGVLVSALEPDSAAYRAGLRKGDIIREINRKPVKRIEDFERLTDGLDSQAPVLLLITRGEATIFLSVKPG